MGVNKLGKFGETATKLAQLSGHHTNHGGMFSSFVSSLCDPPVARDIYSNLL